MSDGKDSAARQEFVVGERLESMLPAGRILLEMDTAALRVALSLYPNNSGESFTEEQVRTMLHDFRIGTGIQDDEIQWAVSHTELFNELVERAIVAKGQEPVAGRDSYMEYTILNTMKARETDPKDPRLFCERRIVNAREGQQLAIRHPLEEGVAGTTLRDMPIPVRPGADVAPMPGRNVSMVDNVLYAKCDGRFLVEEFTVHVEEELFISGDLTLALGDVDFIGGILVAGNIEAGVNVRGQRDIQVRGSVIGCNLICEGNLRVDCGIIGSEGTRVRVLGNLEVDFIENANVTVWGDCTATDNIATSTVICGKKLTMGTGRGLFISGAAVAREGIDVQVVGIPVGTRARLSVGRNLPAEERWREVEAEIEEIDAWLAETQELEAQSGPTTLAFMRLSEAERERLRTRLEDEYPAMIARRAAAEAELERLEPIMTPQNEALVKIARKAYADTVIEFPLARSKLISRLTRVTFRYNSEDMRIETIQSHI